jgi:hypothetical protein
MKLTRRLLRKLIIEAIIDEADTKRYISSPDGDVTPADLAVITAQGKDLIAADVHPSIATLVQSDDIESRAQGRVLADTLEDIPELTPGEATAIDQIGYKKAFEKDRGLEHPIDKELLYSAMKSKSKSLLKHFGFMYIEDAPHLTPGTDEWEDMGGMFLFQAKTLGCDVEDLAFVDTEESFKTYTAIYDIMRSMDPSKRSSLVNIPGDDDSFGVNTLHDLDGVQFLFTSHGMGGYYTATICGKEDEKDAMEDLVMESRWK